MGVWCKLHDGITSGQSRIEEVGELYFLSPSPPLPSLVLPSPPLPLEVGSP